MISLICVLAHRSLPGNIVDFAKIDKIKKKAHAFDSTSDYLRIQSRERARVSKLYRFMALPWRGKWLYLSTSFWLLAVKAGLCLLPFDRLRKWMVGFGEIGGEPADIEKMRAIIQAIERISQFLAPLQISCLPQALVGHRLLRRKGFDVQMKIGVLKNRGDQLAAHAWLEYQGRVILGDLGNLGQFTSFPPLEVAR